MFPGSSTLLGLRGLLCLHIMVSHYILWSQSVLLGLTINLNAPVEMPLFFLLSGFTLALSNYPENDQHSSISCLKFYRNRFARLAPLYYVSNVFCPQYNAFHYSHSVHTMNCTLGPFRTLSKHPLAPPLVIPNRTNYGNYDPSLSSTAIHYYHSLLSTLVAI